MAEKIVIAGSDGVTASQGMEFYRQISDGSIDGLYLKKVLHHFEPDRRFDPEENKVTALQLRHFWRLVEEKKITGALLQKVLERQPPFGVKTKKRQSKEIIV